MKKRMIIISIMLVMTMILTGCVSKKEEKEKIIKWQEKEPTESNLTEEEKELFTKATEEYTEMELTPITLLGTQTVSGINYMFLCRGKTISNRPVKSWEVVTIYKDILNNISLYSIKKLDIAKYLSNESTNDNQTLLGGWEVTEHESSIGIDDRTYQYFKQALEKEPYERKPILILGTQVTGGTTYAVLGTEKIQGLTFMDILLIDIDLDGKAKLTNTSSFNLFDFKE